MTIDDDVAVGELGHVAHHEALAAAVNAASATYVPKADAQTGTTVKQIWAVSPDAPSGSGPAVMSVTQNMYTSVSDPTLAVGINLLANGTLHTAGDAALGIAFENNYNDGTANRKQEMYTQFNRSDGLGYCRPLFIQFDRTNKKITAVQISGDGTTQVLGAGKVGFFGTAPSAVGGDPTSFAVMDVALQQVTVYASDTAADTTLLLKAATGRAAALSLGYNALDNKVVLASASATSANLTVNALVNTYWYAQPIGAAGSAMAVGVNDNAAVGTFGVGTSNTGVKGLVVRGRTSQNASLFEAQDESSNVHVKITKGNANNSLRASLVVGYVALATTATDGFIYAPSMAGTPSGVPTTQTGTVATVIDTTGSKLWAYIGGAWKSVTLA